MSLEVRIDKRLGDFHLDVDFATGDGCMGVLGASGSGKSMILKCIAGIERPDRGRIAVNGRTLFDSSRQINLAPQQRRVGYLFQNYALFPHMTIEKNVGIGVTRPGPERARLVGGLLERFHLSGMEKRYPDQLSGGEQQRAALARMLAAEPEVILLDEPFSALDPHLREEMQLSMMDIIRECRDVVMVTHNRDEAYRMCGELAVLEAGAVLRRGGVRELFSDPGHVLVARVTGCKNVSRVERLGGDMVWAVDWGVRLRAVVAVPDGVTHVGIRAHDFEPVVVSGVDEVNVVELCVCRHAEDLFEWNVIFTSAGGGGEIWWKYSKYAVGSLPTHVRFPPEALLFLRG